MPTERNTSLEQQDVYVTVKNEFEKLQQIVECGLNVMAEYKSEC